MMADNLENLDVAQKVKKTSKDVLHAARGEVSAHNNAITKLSRHMLEAYAELVRGHLAVVGALAARIDDRAAKPTRATPAPGPTTAKRRAAPRTQKA